MFRRSSSSIPARLLNDVEGWGQVRRRYWGKSRRQYLRLNGAVLSFHASRKAPIEWDISVLHGTLTYSLRRATILIVTPIASKLYLQLENRASTQQWVSALQISTVRCFDSTYELMEKIGEGAFASVHKALRKFDHQVVAVKEIKKKQFNMQMARELEREMYAMKYLHHPQVISGHDVFNTQEKVQIVLDYMEGGTLKDNIQEVGGCIDEMEALPIIRQVLEACAHLHSHGYVHRDIKLENVLCESNQILLVNVRLADFGYVNFVDDPRDECLKSLVGTPVYVAPEIINRHDYGTAVDVYAVGVMLHRMICGLYPFDGREDDERTMALAVQANLTFKDPAWKNVSPQCISFVRALLQPRPECRLSADAALVHPWMCPEWPGGAGTERLPPLTDATEEDGMIGGKNGDFMSPVTPGVDSCEVTRTGLRQVETLIIPFAPECAEAYEGQLAGHSRMSDTASTVSKGDDRSARSSVDRRSEIETEEWIGHSGGFKRVCIAAIFVAKLSLVSGVRRASPRRRFHMVAERRKDRRVSQDEDALSNRRMPTFSFSSARWAGRGTFYSNGNTKPLQLVSDRLRKTLSFNGMA